MLHDEPTGTATGPVDADGWYDWLLRARHGGDAGYAAALAPQLAEIRANLLDHARLGPGQRIADIGCGDGFAGFGALERQPDGAVTFVDVSPALVDHARAEAERRGVAGRCRFVVASATDLAQLADGAFDVVLVRAVLAYVDDRTRAIGELRRILRPGGRVSVVDPIFQDRAFAVAGMADVLRDSDATPATRRLELLQRCRAAQLPASVAAIRNDPITNYNERDLLRLFEIAGFAPLHLRLHVDCVPALPMPWAVFLASSPRAGAPAIATILETRFTSAERHEFERAFRPGIEAGSSYERNINAYIFGDAA